MFRPCQPPSQPPFPLASISRHPLKRLTPGRARARRAFPAHRRVTFLRGAPPARRPPPAAPWCTSEAVRVGGCTSGGSGHGLVCCVLGGRAACQAGFKQTNKQRVACRCVRGGFGREQRRRSGSLGACCAACLALSSVQLRFSCAALLGSAGGLGGRRHGRLAIHGRHRGLESRQHGGRAIDGHHSALHSRRHGSLRSRRHGSLEQGHQLGVARGGGQHGRVRHRACVQQRLRGWQGGETRSMGQRWDLPVRPAASRSTAHTGLTCTTSISTGSDSTAVARGREPL